MTGTSTAARIYGGGVAAEWQRFGSSLTPAQKSTVFRKTCGKKATAGVSQRGTGV
jgi:hypothetical protein